MRRAEWREGGFTLVEVLVALVATGLLLAILFDGVTTARRRTADADLQRHAVMVARAAITRAAAKPYEQGTRREEVGKLSLDITQNIERADPRGLIALVRIHVIARDASRQVLFDGSTVRVKSMVAP